MRRTIVAACVAILGLTGCGLAEFGPWLSPTGAPLEGSQVVEFEGFRQCGWEDVIFIRFFGAQYAKDPEGVLGELRSVDGERRLTYEVLDELPEGAIATGITHEGREIHFVEETREDYLYISRPDGRVEQRPRAEVECE